MSKKESLKRKKNTSNRVQTVARKRSKKSLSPEENSIVATPAATSPASLTDDELQRELKKFLIPKLRSASYRWSERSKAIKKARVSRGLYKCAMCLREDVKNGEFVMDHKEPVVPYEGWNGTDWTQYIVRMFAKEDKFQALCKPCHSIKTDSEVQIRKLYREKKKKENK